MSDANQDPEALDKANNFLTLEQLCETCKRVSYECVCAND